MEELFTDLLVKVIVAVTVPAVSVFFCWLRNKTESLTRGLMKSDELRKVVNIIVSAMEEEFRGQAGEFKREKATEMIAAYGSKHGLSLDVDMIGTLIDAAVTGLRKAGIKEQAE